MNRNVTSLIPAGDNKKQPGGERVGERGRAVRCPCQEPRQEASAVPVTRRQTVTDTAGSPLSPLSGGRPLPSKWEDAERWICSPISAGDRSPLPRSRTKSKSGPLEQPSNYIEYAGGQHSGFYSPIAAAVELEGWTTGGFSGAGSSFSTGVFPAYESRAVSCVVENDSKGVNRWLDERLESTGSADNGADRVASRRDMATQMSPDSSVCSSPKRTSVGPYAHPPRTKLEEEARDSQRIQRLNFVSLSKRHAAWFKKRDQSASKDDSSYDVFTAEVRGSLPVDIRAEREEAKITAWENLQKAKAEAAIRKLEAKLEKKRLSSMDRILKRLRRAELKAQEMRRRWAADDRPRDHPGNTIKQRTACKQHLRSNILHCFH
ncbi:hypothetical protein SAY86_031146 [Trapa natans]|uniref:Remorin C-terminal domain-containing protein n=1 Tax=Trapa natans TaxID=22666 RepID=A0AAN7MP05_TRANT|nr:hypothetical protein SAY86_031146 [Trapa natans]